MEKSQRDLSVLTREERIRILRHIGINPLPNDIYGQLPSVIASLRETWNCEECILDHPNKDSNFPVINQKALFVRKCYHELFEIIIKVPTPKNQLPIRILLTGTPGIGKSTFL